MTAVVPTATQPSVDAPVSDERAADSVQPEADTVCGAGQ